MADGCPRFHALMHARLDGDISREDDRFLSLHLDSCSDCRSMFLGMQTSVAIFAAMPAPDPGPAFAAAVMRRAVATRRARRRVAWSATAAAAAAVAIAAMLVLGVWTGLVEPSLPGLLWGIPKLLYGAGKTVLVISQVFAPLLDVAAGLVVEGVFAVLPLYLLALVTITFVSLLYRVKRPLATLPVLSI